MLVVVFSAAGGYSPDAKVELAHRVSMSLDASAALLMLALLVVLTCVVQRRHIPLQQQEALS